MKVLVVFMDMLRPNLLEIYNKNIKQTSLDNYFIKQGGILCKKAYTPGPDTPRALGAFWSGIEPWNNGCDKRAKYPEYFLNKSTFLDELYEKGFQLNFFLSPYFKEIGALPTKISKNPDVFLNNNFNLKCYLEQIQNQTFENTFTFIDLQDYHWALDDYNYTYKGVKKGKEELVVNLLEIEKKLEIEKYDLVIYFSDHGHKLNEGFKIKKEIKTFINDDRTQIFLLIKEKKDKKLREYSSLLSICDIGELILQKIETNKKIQELLFENKREEIIIEDHLDFSVEVNLNLGIWGVIKENEKLFKTLDDIYYEGKVNNIEELEKKLIEKTNYKEYVKEYNVLKMYGNMKQQFEVYTSGNKRKLKKWESNLGIFKKIYTKLEKYIFFYNKKSYLFK